MEDNDDKPQENISEILGTIAKDVLGSRRNKLKRNDLIEKQNWQNKVGK